MSDYIKSTNFAVKDTLATGNPAKIVKGTEIDTEFNAIASAVASKLDANSPTLTGTPLAPTASTATNNTQIATTAYVVNRVAQDITGKANIASPTFSGVPAAPTPVLGTNTTQIATTAFVAEGLALKANLLSPTFTGTPSAPTAVVGTNTTQLATTAFVQAAVGGVNAGVLTFSGGTTGLTPSTATAGAIVLAGTLGVANGGTGQTTYTNGQLLIGNSTGNTLAKATLTAGTGISITNGAGSITVASTLTLGPNAQVFTSNGTFTIPTGVTKLKVTVVGGGGGGGQQNTSGSAGGTSSVASGTQSITTIQATGGGAGLSGGSAGAGGVGSNGDLNIRGGVGDGAVSFSASSQFSLSQIRNGGASFISPYTSLTTNTYGVGGVGDSLYTETGTSLGGPGGGGGAAIKWLSSLTPGNTLSVTVGSGGAGSVSGKNGSPGIVIIEW